MMTGEAVISAGAMRDAAVAWAKRGFRVFPCIAGTKEPLVKAFYDYASADPETVFGMWTDPVTGWPQSHNVGVDTSSLIVVDIDMKNGKDGLSSYMALDLPLDTLIVRTPSSGRHAYLEGPPKSLSVGRLGQGLDIRSYHGYVIAPGSWLDAADPRNKGVGGFYEIDNDAPLIAAPPHLIAKLDEPRERNAAPASVELDTEFAVARARKYLTEEAEAAIEGAGGDLLAYRVAARIKDFGISQDKALDLIVDYYLPRCAAGWSFDEQIDWFKVKIENAYSYGLSAPGSQSPVVDTGQIIVIEPAQAKRSDRRWFQHGDDWIEDTAWLYFETLPQIGVGVLTGPSQSGKTFMVAHLARSLATGKPFFDSKPDDVGGTIVVTGEGRRSVRLRMAALEEPERLPIYFTDISNLAEAGALPALMQTVYDKSQEMLVEHGVPLRLLVIETLSASGLLRDENDNSEAGTAFKALGILAEKLQCFIIVTHHPPKTGNGMRGAGAIYNDVDIVMEITREKTNAIREIAITKARDAQQRKLGVFTLVPVRLGEDSRGRAVTSCVVSDSAMPMRASGGTPKNAELLVECTEWGIVDEGIEIEGRKTVDIEIVKSIFKERYTGSKDASNFRRMWDTTIAWCLEAGSVEIIAHSGRKHLALLSLS